MLQFPIDRKEILFIRAANDIRQRQQLAVDFPFDHDRQVDVVEHDEVATFVPVGMHSGVRRNATSKYAGRVAGDRNRLSRFRHVARNLRTRRGRVHFEKQMDDVFSATLRKNIQNHIAISGEGRTRIFGRRQAQQVT